MTEFLQGLICGGVASFAGCFLAGAALFCRKTDEIELLKESLRQSHMHHANSLKVNTEAISELRGENLRLNADVRLLKSENEKLKLTHQGRVYELECKLRVIEAAIEGKVKMFDDGHVYVQPGDDE